MLEILLLFNDIKVNKTVQMLYKIVKCPRLSKTVTQLQALRVLIRILQALLMVDLEIEFLLLKKNLIHRISLIVALLIKEK